MKANDMRKDPTLACLLTLLLAGTGHIYVGQTGKGLLILALGIVLGVFTWGIAYVVLCVWAMSDAYGTAKKMNRRERKDLTDRAG